MEEPRRSTSIGFGLSCLWLMINEDPECDLPRYTRQKPIEVNKQLAGKDPWTPPHAAVVIKPSENRLVSVMVVGGLYEPTPGQPHTSTYISISAACIGFSRSY